MTAQDVTLLIYNLALLPVIFFSVLFIILSLINILVERHKRKVPHFAEGETLPFVSVQIPTFNDPIGERCVRRCLAFDYPQDRYEIIIVDDSTNPQTQALLKGLAEANAERVKYIHRENREGYKPGALNNAMPITKGEILVLFDADWVPAPDFLKKVVQPFADPEVALVQTRQGFYNQNTNWITRYAAYLLMVYHSIIMPINNKVNAVLFCGTAGALRRSAFEEVGGWNLDSITEDADLSVHLLMKGYKSVYLDFETPSEVPDTFEGFLKQQMRWCYGNARVFFDNAGSILLGKKLTLRQRLVILYVTLGNLIAPAVVIMTVFGFSGWFVGTPTLLQWTDVWTMLWRFLITAGFLIMGIITFYKRSMLKEVPYLIATVFTLGLVLAVANSIAFVKAIANRKLHWYCTPKAANQDAL